MASFPYAIARHRTRARMCRKMNARLLKSARARRGETGGVRAFPICGLMKRATPTLRPRAPREARPTRLCPPPFGRPLALGSRWPPPSSPASPPRTPHLHRCPCPVPAGQRPPKPKDRAPTPLSSLLSPLFPPLLSSPPGSSASSAQMPSPPLASAPLATHLFSLSLSLPTLPPPPLPTSPAHARGDLLFMRRPPERACT